MRALLGWLLIGFIAVAGGRMELSSLAFENGKMIPANYSCDEADISPPLIFSNIPKDAKSLALVMDDPDAPGGVFVHWVIYDIPPTVTKLPQGLPKVPILPNGIKQGRNDFGDIGYGGPCPPKGAHRYFFTLYALSADLNLSAGLTKSQLLDRIRNYIIEESTLMGFYKRR